MTPLALASFNQARLKAQYTLFGRPVIYGGVTYTGCHSGVTNMKELREGGFALIHDFICKIRKSDMVTRPKEEAELTVAGVIYKIKEVIDHPLAGEWKLGLRSKV